MPVMFRSLSGMKKGGMMEFDFMDLMDTEDDNMKRINDVNNKELNDNKINNNNNNSNNNNMNDNKLLNKVDSEKMKFNKRELRELKGVHEIDKNLNSITKGKDKKKIVLDINFEFDSLPKLSEGIVNKEVIMNIPDNLKSFIPEGFNFKELDQKFSDFIKFLFISKKHISKKNFKMLVQGLFNILTELGVDREIQIMYRDFLFNEVEIIKDFNLEKYENLVVELSNYCERRNCILDIKS
jgi:hypothetical protein